MARELQMQGVQTLSPLIEQYEFECLLSSRNAEQGRPSLAPMLQAQPVGNQHRR